MTAIAFKPRLALAVTLNLKTQTRRGIAQGVVLNPLGQILTPVNHSWANAVYSVNNVPDKKPRIKWRVGMELPYKASRTGKALGYVMVDEIRIQDVRDMKYLDAVAEQCMGMYAGEPFENDPQVCFWYTWLALNKMPAGLFRELTLPLWDEQGPVTRRAQFKQRMNRNSCGSQLSPDYFMAYALSFTNVPSRITDAGRAFLAEQTNIAMAGLLTVAEIAAGR